MTVPGVLALVESNTTGTGRLFAAAARARGLRPVLLSTSPGRYPWVADDRVDVAWADTANPEAVAAVAAHAAAGATLAGIVTSSEYFAAITARAAVRLGLPGADPVAVDRCRDKRHQRVVLRRAGLAVPAFQAVGSVRAAAHAAADIGFPVVCKPADGTGSRGVRLCPDPASVADHTRRLLARGRDERGRPSLPWVMVEEYVVGPEVSVETFGAEVVGITAKHLGSPPTFVEIGHDFPAARANGDAGAHGDAAAQDEAATVARAAAAALGVDFGPAHIELRLAPDGPVVIEVNPRLAGGRIPVLVRLATGIDLIGVTVDLLTGSGAPLPAPGPGHSAIRFLHAPVRGRVLRAGGVAEAAAVPGVVDVAVSAAAGELVGGTGCFLDRLGHVIAAGPTSAAAVSAADAGLAALVLELDCAGWGDPGAMTPPVLAGGLRGP